MKCFALLVSLACVVGLGHAATNCAELGKCCTGQSSSCQAQGPRQLAGAGDSTACFCDEHCHKSGDCCADILEACPKQNCEIGEFGDWGDCSEACGWGYMKRSRPIIRTAKNGGTPCDQTNQKTYCMGLKCKGKRQSSSGWRELSETAKIVPAEFGAWRNDKLYNPYSDIRKNLFYHYKKENKIHRPAYCAEFEVTEDRDACANSPKFPWAANLKVGAKACVECQPSAMKKHLGVRCKGHGVYLSETRWNAVTVPDCHGKWTLTNKHQEGCSCNPQSPTSFVFV